MTGGEGLVLLLPEDADSPVAWLRMASGRIIAADTDAALLDDVAAEGPLVALAPSGSVTLHWIDCAGMTERQADAAARIMALDASLGDRSELHAAVAEQTSGDTRLVAVTNRPAMAMWRARLAELGAASAPIVPTPLALPEPEDTAGFVTSQIGGQRVARGWQSGFSLDDGLGDLLIGDAPTVELRPEAVEAGLAAQLAAPALNLNQGDFAPRRSGGFDAIWARRFGWAVAAGLAFLIATPVVEIIKLRSAASDLDAEVVRTVGSRLPGVTDASSAQSALNAELARRGAGTSFTAIFAAMMSALQSSPDVTVTNAGQTADGTVRIVLSAPDTQAINRVLIAIQQSGWRIVANNAGTAGGRATADISVMPQ